MQRLLQLIAAAQTLHTAGSLPPDCRTLPLALPHALPLKAAPLDLDLLPGLVWYTNVLLAQSTASHLAGWRINLLLVLPA